MSGAEAAAWVVEFWEALPLWMNILIVLTLVGVAFNR